MSCTYFSRASVELVLNWQEHDCLETESSTFELNSYGSTDHFIGSMACHAVAANRCVPLSVLSHFTSTPRPLALTLSGPLLSSLHAREDLLTILCCG